MIEIVCYWSFENHGAYPKDDELDRKWTKDTLETLSSFKEKWIRVSKNILGHPQLMVLNTDDRIEMIKNTIHAEFCLDQVMNGWLRGRLTAINDYINDLYVHVLHDECMELAERYRKLSAQLSENKHTPFDFAALPRNANGGIR